MQSLCKKIHTTDDDIINTAEQNICPGTSQYSCSNNFLTLDVGLRPNSESKEGNRVPGQGFNKNSTHLILIEN